MELKEFCQTLHKMGVFELNIYKQGECSKMLEQELSNQNKEEMKVFLVKNTEGIRSDFIIVYGIKFNLIKKDETIS